MRMPIQLPTNSRDYVISIQQLRRDDALTLSCLAAQLGSELGAHAARRIDREGFTVCWSAADRPGFDAPPDLIVALRARPRPGGAPVLALSGLPADEAASGGADAPNRGPDAGSSAAPARLYTLGAWPHGSAEYIANMCCCPTAYVALGALCRAMGFVPVQLVQHLLCATLGRTEPHRLCNCEEGALRGYRQLTGRASFN